MKAKLLAIILSALALGSESQADELDLQKILDQRTLPLIQGQINAICSVPWHRCFAVRYINVKLIPLEVEYSDVKQDALPIETSKQTFYFRNCSGSLRRDTRNTVMTYTEGYTITKSTTVNNTLGATLNFAIQGVKVGVNATETVNFLDSEVINRVKTRSDSVTLIEDIAAYTDLDVTIVVKIGRAFLDFLGTVEIEADVVMAMSGGAHGWYYPIGRLSDILDNRTFKVGGQIWNGKAEETSKIYQEIQYTKETCPLGERQEDTQFVVADSGASIMAMAADGVQSGASATVEEMVTNPYLITTANTVSNVQVNAKSLGPGFCGVDISTDSGNSASFLAPPFAWSDWVNLTSHVGSVSYSISTEAKCDTGALFQVRYFK